MLYMVGVHFSDQLERFEQAKGAVNKQTPDLLRIALNVASGLSL
jgi:hypothetical protein